MKVLFDLFERFVVAHEKQAEAAMMMAQGRGGGCCSTKDPAAAYPAPPIHEPNGTECTAPKAPAGPEWDPYTSMPATRYPAEKQAILRRELGKQGIEPGDKLNGRELHDLLLQQKNKPAVIEQVYAEPVPVEVPAAPLAPAAPTPPAAPAAPVATDVTLDMIRDSLNALLMKGDEARKCGLDLLIEATGGHARLTDAATGASLLPADQRAPLYAKVQDALGRF